MELGVILGAIGGIVVAVALVAVLIMLAGAGGNITAIAENFSELCTKISDWWNGVCVWFVESGEAIVEFFEGISSFLGL
jgi:hypothetical protein